MTATDLPEDLPVEAVCEALFEWFEVNHRPFPWRETDDPWSILVLEVMSQQTQLERVTEAWERFIERWPEPAELAEDDPASLIAFWSEHRLGYNRRASYLHDAATMIVERFDGSVPETVEELRTLAGIGPYTANAVASFAFGRGGPVIDTNVKRVLYRAFDVVDDDATFAAASERLAPTDAIGTWNAAIMELGGVACTRTPACDDAACPLRQWCVAYRTGDFTAPDVPEQPPYEGSRRQHRGTVLTALREEGELSIDRLGHHLRVDYDPEGRYGREWLLDLLEEMEADGLVTVDVSRSQPQVTLGS